MCSFWGKASKATMVKDTANKHPRFKRPGASSHIWLVAKSSKLVGNLFCQRSMAAAPQLPASSGPSPQPQIDIGTRHRDFKFSSQSVSESLFCKPFIPSTPAQFKSKRLESSLTVQPSQPARSQPHCINHQARCWRCGDK